MESVSNLHTSDCYTFLTDSKPTGETMMERAIEDLVNALNTSAIGFLDINVVLRGTLTPYLDSTPPEEIDPEVLSRSGKWNIQFAEKILLHPRIWMSEGILQKLEPLCDIAGGVITRDIASYSVSYASLEARRLLPFLREYKNSLESITRGLTQLHTAKQNSRHPSLFSAVLQLAQLLSEDQVDDDNTFITLNLVASSLYEFLVRQGREPSQPIEVVIFTCNPRVWTLLANCVRLARDPELLGLPHRLTELFDSTKTRSEEKTRKGGLSVLAYHDQAQRFGHAYNSNDPIAESLESFWNRLGIRDEQKNRARALVQTLVAEQERALNESVIPTGSDEDEITTVPPFPTPKPTSSAKPANALSSLFSDWPEDQPTTEASDPSPVVPIEASRIPMETMQSTIEKQSPEPIPNIPTELSSSSPTLENLPATEDLTSQVLRKLYRRSHVSLSQVSGDVERLGEKLILDEGTRRLAEKSGDEALAKALTAEVAVARQVIEGKLAILQTQKNELLQKKSALNSEIEALRASSVFVANAVDREMELLGRDSELGRSLSEVLGKLRQFSPLAEGLAKIGSGGGMPATPSAEGNFRLGQLVEELGDEPHNVSALIKQLREKTILPPKGPRGLYTSQERQIILDMSRSKSISEIARDWGNAVTTLKQAVEQRLIEGRDYYNLGKGSQRDSYRVTPLGMAKLKAALSLTRARQNP